MKVKELIKELEKANQNAKFIIVDDCRYEKEKTDDEIVITSMDNDFFCEDFEIHSPYTDGQAQEIILPYYINDFEKEEE